MAGGGGAGGEAHSEPSSERAEEHNTAVINIDSIDELPDFKEDVDPSQEEREGLQHEADKAGAELTARTAAAEHIAGAAS